MTRDKKIYFIDKFFLKNSSIPASGNAVGIVQNQKKNTLIGTSVTLMKPKCIQWSVAMGLQYCGSSRLMYMLKE